MQPTSSINIGTNQAEIQAAIAAARDVKPEAQDPRRKARKELLARAQEQHATGQYAGTTEAVLDAATESPQEDGPDRNLDSITFQLPNGKVVEFGPPPGISLTAKMLALFQGRDFSAAEETVTWTLCCLRTVDGVRVSITDLVMRDKWMQTIGDDGYGVLRYAMNKYFPPLRKFDLQVIEKKMR